jgi:hypothetical protein
MVRAKNRMLGRTLSLHIVIYIYIHRNSTEFSSWFCREGGYLSLLLSMATYLSQPVNSNRKNASQKSSPPRQNPVLCTQVETGK